MIVVYFVCFKTTISLIVIQKYYDRQTVYIP